MIEDRAGPLGRLGVGDRGADDGVEDLLPEAVLQRRQRLPRVDRAHVGEVQQDPEQLEVGVEALTGQLDHFHRLLDALQGEVLRLGGDQRAVGGDQRVDRQQPQRGRAVDQDHVVVVEPLRQRPPQRQLAPHLAAQHQLGLRQREVGGDDVLADRLGRARAAGQHLGDRGLDVGRQVEVLGEVALRVQVDGERAHPAAPQHVGERPYRGRLAGAALLREDGDLDGHRPDTTHPRRARSG